MILTENCVALNFILMMRERMIFIGICVILVNVLQSCDCNVNTTEATATLMSNETLYTNENNTATNSTLDPYNGTMNAENSTVLPSSNVTTQTPFPMSDSYNSTQMLTLNYTEQMNETTLVPMTKMYEVNNLTTMSGNMTPQTSVILMAITSTTARPSTYSMTSEKKMMMTSHKMDKPTTMMMKTTTQILTTYGTNHGTNTGGNKQEPDTTANIIISIVVVVLFLLVAVIVIVCIVRRKRSKNQSRSFTMTNPTMHDSNRKLDFKNMNDNGSPAEFMLDKNTIDLESPVDDGGALHAIAMLDNATGDFGSTEITTFKTSINKDSDGHNGEVPKEGDGSDDTGDDESESDPDEDNGEAPKAGEGSDVAEDVDKKNENSDPDEKVKSEDTPNPTGGKAIDTNDEKENEKSTGENKVNGSDAETPVKEDSENKPMPDLDSKKQTDEQMSEL